MNKSKLAQSIKFALSTYVIVQEFGEDFIHADVSPFGITAEEETFIGNERIRKSLGDE
jgi:hypothetical protein